MKPYLNNKLRICLYLSKCNNLTKANHRPWHFEATINLINVSNISKYNFQIYYVIENLCLYFILILNDCMTLKDNKWTDTLSSKTWRGGRKRRICAVGRMKVYEGRERRNATFKTGETTNAYCIVRDTTTVHGSSLNLLITEWNYIETFCE